MRLLCALAQSTPRKLDRRPRATNAVDGGSPRATRTTGAEPETFGPHSLRGCGSRCVRSSDAPGSGLGPAHPSSAWGLGAIPGCRERHRCYRPRSPEPRAHSSKGARGRGVRRRRSRASTLLRRCARPPAPTVAVTAWSPLVARPRAAAVGSSRPSTRRLSSARRAPYKRRSPAAAGVGRGGSA